MPTREMHCDILSNTSIDELSKMAVKEKIKDYGIDPNSLKISDGVTTYRAYFFIDEANTPGLLDIQERYSFIKKVSLE